MNGLCLLCRPLVEFSTVDEWADHEQAHADEARRKRLAAIEADPPPREPRPGRVRPWMKVASADVAVIMATHDSRARAGLARSLGITPHYASQLYHGSKVRSR